VVGDRLYLLGSEGVTNEFAEALATHDGKRLWSTRLGSVGQPQQQPNFPTARSTPTVERPFLYVLGSDGDLACLALETGKIRWQKNLRTDFDGKPGQWAYAESPLLDGDALICTPGGSRATMIALNKETGAVLWTCAVPGGDSAAYASAITVEAAGARQYVQLLQNGLVGIDAKTGRFLWRYKKPVSRYGANIPSPLASGDRIYCASAGTGGGLVQLNAQDGEIKPEEAFFGPKYPTSIGGAIKVGDWLYGTTGEAMVCVDFASGQLKWQERSIGAASLCYVDGRLYLHGEDGQVALVEPSPDGYLERGRFTPPNEPKHAEEMEKAWAYPVVANGHLFIRDHGTIWCYNVRSGE
jgi:outer membrane protein assembly factor BamB